MTKSVRIILMPPYYKRNVKRKSEKLNKKTTSKLTFSNKTKAKIKRYAVLSLFFIFSFLFIAVLGFWNFLNKNLASASNPYGLSLKESIFPSFVYVVLDDINKEIPEVTKIEMVLLDTNTSRAYVYNVPLDMEIDIPGRYSKEKISKIFALGSLDEKDSFNSGVNMLLDTIFKLYAFRVEKYFVVDNTLEKPFDEFVFNGSILGFTNKYTIESLNSHLKTNLDISEFYKLAVDMGNVPQNRIIRKDFMSNFVSNPEFIDKEIREFTITSKLNEEQKTIAVLNASTVSGAANFASRVIQNIGGRIIAVDNSKENIKNSYIIADDLSSETVNVISEIFKIKTIVSKDDTKDFTYMDIIDRSDVVVILGFDISQDL